MVLMIASGFAQSWDLNVKNISGAMDSAISINKDPFRPGYHLTPPIGCMGDPNGGIYHDGWYHIFYGLQPFAWHPGAWYWAQARSKNLLHWEHMEPGLVPDFDLGLGAIGSGSTIHNDGTVIAFHSQSGGTKGGMKFWQAQFTNDDLTEWKHGGKNPVLTLEYPGLPPYDGFWRDPYVFHADGRTFLIACADLLEEDYVPVPIFEAKNDELTEWGYKGNLFTVPKHKYRNLEVPDFKPLGDKWMFTASTDAPIDRVNYFIGEFDADKLKFEVEKEGILDYSGHYYAQESILDDEGDLYMMAWMPGWDRPWLPLYMNDPIKNSNKLWNGCFAIPRKLKLVNGNLVQQPVEKMKELRADHYTVKPKELPVKGATTAFEVIEEFSGNQLEILVEFELYNASFCGINLLSDKEGKGGLPIIWSGNLLNVDGVKVPMEEWKPGETLKMQIFVDKKLVEVFVNDGKYCISRQVREEYVKGGHVALTSLGGTGKLISLEAWKLKTIN